MKVLDTIKIKIKFRNIDENPLAIVTLNLNDEIDIRFCPIFWKQSNKGIFFTMPSLKSKGYQTCVVVLDENEYKKLQERILQEFIEKAKEHYYPDEFLKIEAALRAEREVEVKIEDIPL